MHVFWRACGIFLTDGTVRHTAAIQILDSAGVQRGAAAADGVACEESIYCLFMNVALTNLGYLGARAGLIGVVQ